MSTNEKLLAKLLTVQRERALKDTQIADAIGVSRSVWANWKRRGAVSKDGFEAALRALGALEKSKVSLISLFGPPSEDDDFEIDVNIPESEPLVPEAAIVRESTNPYGEGWTAPIGKKQAALVLAAQTMAGRLPDDVAEAITKMILVSAGAVHGTEGAPDAKA